MRTALTTLILVLASSLVSSQSEFDETDLGYTTFRDNCMACHLSSGMGIREMNAPSIAGLPRWYISGELRLFQQGKRGFHKEDASGNLMRINTVQLDERAVAFLGRYIASLPANTERNTLDVEPAADAQNLYNHHCASCHGEAGNGNRAVRTPPLNEQQDWYLLRQIENFKSGKRVHSKDFDYPEIPIEATHAIIAWLSSLPSE